MELWVLVVFFYICQGFSLLNSYKYLILSMLCYSNLTVTLHSDLWVAFFGSERSTSYMAVRKLFWNVSRLDLILKNNICETSSKMCFLHLIPLMDDVSSSNKIVVTAWDTEPMSSRTFSRYGKSFSGKISFKWFRSQEEDLDGLVADSSILVADAVVPPTNKWS